MKKAFQLFVCLLFVSGMLTLSGCVDDTSDIPDVTQSGLQDYVLYQVSTINALLISEDFNQFRVETPITMYQGFNVIERTIRQKHHM
jgi:hypothetical protein